MSDLILDSYLIDEPIINILTKLRSELTNGKLAFIEQKNDYVRVTCPDHKSGLERHASCSVYCGDGDLQYGYYNCLTCGSKGNLRLFVAKCFDKPYEFGKQWLIENFGHIYVTNKISLEEINLTKEKKEKDYLDESILEGFSDYHPYMTKRGLSDEIIKKFELKYDPEYQAIVFPVRDLKGNLVGLTRRSVKNKRFWLQAGFDKKNIYLLYNIIKDGVREVYVCESQINALTLESWGYRAIALFGAGTTEEQIDVLNKTGIKHYILCYDNDPAGKKGASRFKKFIRKDVFVDEVTMPEGRDINDLTKEEFERLLNEQFN